MLGSVAQVIALTAYGNAALQNPESVSSPVFYPSNSTFRFCEYVRFVDVTVSGNARQETAWATDPGAWFDRLRKERAYALRLHYGTPHDPADKEYERLSEDLFVLLNRTYVAVANTTASAAR